jgi:hypothetical protein
MHHDDLRFIARNVNGGSRGLNHDDFLFNDDHLFIVRGEIPGGIGQVAYTLDRGHYVFELGAYDIAE